MADDRLHLFCEILLAIILPPLGVCLRDGCCSCEFWVCCLLTLLGYLPGIVYAIYAIVVKRRDQQPEALPESHYSPLAQ